MSGPRFETELLFSEDSSYTVPVIFDPSTGNLSVDYTSKIDELSLKIDTLSSALDRIATSLENLETLAGGTGIKFRDVFAPLSYSALVKLYKEDGEDINELIKQTNDIVKRL